VYVLTPKSRLDVRTGKAGLLGFVGHEHLIRARAFTGRIVYHPDTPATSRIEIVVKAESLEVLTPPDTAEIRKVTAAMRTEVLDVANHPEIRLVSHSISSREGHFRLLAALTLKGQTRLIPIDVFVEVGGNKLLADATFSVRQTDFGIQPYRGGPGGTVRVADQVKFIIRAEAIRDLRR
jgi:polyisoprenoid-binding protein YceI